jgi:photosystem II stability/assembly factor-like uncharacterized protein
MIGIGLAAAAAAEPRWVPIGPPGGEISSAVVAANGRTIYAAGGASGVFKSANGGRSWSATGSGVIGGVSELAAGTRDPGTLFANTQQRVYATFDAGATWAERDSGLPATPGDRFLYGLAVAPSRPSTLFVLARAVGAIQSVYRSLDAGQSWSRVASGLAKAGAPNRLAIHPSDPAIAYLATSTGIFRTANNGKRWVPSGLSGQGVSFVAIDSVRPSQLLAYALPPGEEAHPQVYVSTNGGTTWTIHPHDFGTPLQAIVPDAKRAGWAYAANGENHLFVTTDGGLTWTPNDDTFPADTRVTGFAVDPTRAGVLFAVVGIGAGPGIFKSLDFGASWTPSAAGIQTQSLPSFAADPTRAGVLYAGLSNIGGGLLKSTDGGASWNPSGLDGQQIRSLAIDSAAPATPSTLYASAGGALTVFRSADAGGHWEPLTDDVSNHNAQALAVVGGLLYAGHGDSFLRWDPLENVWQILNGGDVRAIAGSVSGPTVTLWTDNAADLEVCACDVVRRSGDGGATWSNSVTAPGIVQNLAMAPGHPERVAFAYARELTLGVTPGGGVYHSEDGGTTWHQADVAPGGPPVSAVVFDPHDPQRLVASAGGHAYESLDGGTTWHTFGALPGATHLVFDGGAPPALYAATLGAGAFRLVDDRP